MACASAVRRVRMSERAQVMAMTTPNSAMHLSGSPKAALKSCASRFRRGCRTLWVDGSRACAG